MLVWELSLIHNGSIPLVSGLISVLVGLLEYV